ncbi:hypothetical protein [Burkholderia ambifaria]|uniref:hypothetical protein n=1 Tax=Burkholderia ambifaria TaxID=152480 RepID=UPI003C7A5953
MSKTMLLPVKDLTIDLHNFRTVAQRSELEATKAMISISPDYFWGLMESLLDDGYLPTENIIVIEADDGKKVVKEGNRRVASLKIILGQIKAASLNLPGKLSERIADLSQEWEKENSKIPCTVYKESEADLVDRIVTRTHGKGQRAGRDPWEAVARARHNKIANGAAEPGLDLLEKYLKHGENLTPEQKVRWAGRYNLTVLDEAIKKVAPRFSVNSSPELAKKYPKISYKQPLDEIIYAIGVESLTFTSIRESADFALRFGVPPAASASNAGNPSGASAAGNPSSGASTASPGSSAAGSSSSSTSSTKPGNNSAGASSGGTSTNATGGANPSSGSSSNGKPTTTATNDERSVKRSLRALKLFGPNRSKVETLRKEAMKLKLKDNPIAFCFLLRSMFEISAKAYCQDHASEPGAPKSTKADGSDRTLSDVLRDIVSHLTQNGTDKQMQRLLHGPHTEIQRKDGILSLTSMNQLVHNASFTIIPGDIPTLFANIFPLLEQMNK